MEHFNRGKMEPEWAAVWYLICSSFIHALPRFCSSSQRETDDFETTLLRQREESEEDKDFPTAILYTDRPPPY